MNAHVTIADETAVSFVADPQTPLAVLTDPTQADALFARIRSEIDTFVPDLTTAKGREAIKSLAFKVTKTRTAVEAARKETTEGWRRQTDTVNAAGRAIKSRLEALEDEARKPLTEWEEAEKVRVQTVADQMAEIERSTNVFTDDSAEAVAERIATLEAMTFDPEVFRESAERAEAARVAAISTLTGIHARLVQEEKDRAELAALRAAEEERQRIAKEEEQRASYATSIIEHIREVGRGRIGGQTYPYVFLLRELTEKVVIDETFGALEAEARRVLAETLASVQEAMARDAERARVEGEAARAREVEAARQAAADEVKAQQEAAARQERADAERREKNRAHAAKIMGAAKLAIMGLGVPEEQATEVVKAIKAGSIPNVIIQF